MSFDENYVKLKYNQYCKIIEEKLKNHQKPHNSRYKQGFFVPKRPAKVINIMETDEPQPIVFRSGWETTFANWLDTTDAITRWGSECVRILYKNPIKNKMSFYIPDFYMEYLDTFGNLKKVLVEVKPLKEAVLEKATNGRDRLKFAENQMKWQSAIQYCHKRGIEFKIIHENNLPI